MFKPNFTYTNKIVKNLTHIAGDRAVILNIPLIPKWDVSLRREAVLRSAHSSTAIEGNKLSYEEVSRLAEGRDVMATRKDRQEVLNYLEALGKISDFANKNPFTINDLLEIHKIVTNNTLQNQSDEGFIRNRQVYVGNGIGGVIFRPPDTDQVPILLRNFLDWFNSIEVNDINSVIQAGITHYEIVRIHPFIDGNGRTARVMATLALYKRGFDLKRFFALDDYYDQDRQSYYEALRNIDRNTLDLTEWLEYFTDGVALSIKVVKDKVIGLSRDIKFLKERGQIALNDKQIKIVEMIIKNDRVYMGEIAKEFKITRQAALKEMNKLVKLEVIKLEGMGRGAHYKLI